MRIKQILKSAIFAAVLIVFTDSYALSNETYYIDDSPLLLYKTINWWYDSLPKDDGKLCGKPIKCVNTGNARIAYDEPAKKIDIKIKNGLAGMLLAFHKNEQSSGPPSMSPSWLDPDYFKGAAATVVLDDAMTIMGFTFSGIGKEPARRIQAMGPDLQFILEGVIGGLSNDRIALYPSNELLKSCGRVSQKQGDTYPISLRIVNTRTNDSLAVFNMSWDRK